MSDAVAPALAPTSTASPRFLLGLLAIAIPLLFFRLGAKDVWEASEGRPLESAREMRAHGDWLVQYTNGERDLTKPPLYAWLVGVAFAVGGENEFSGRLPSVLASIGVLLAVFVLGRRIAGPRAGFLSALLLLTTAKFLWQARLAEMETLLALGVTWAYVSFDSAVSIPSEGTRSPSPLRSWLSFGLWLGLAAAVKGPIAFLLVLPGAIGYAIFARRARVLRSLGFALGLLISILLGAAWPAAVVLRDGQQALDTLLSFAMGENVGHLHDPFYYLAQYPLYALPWTPLVLFAMRMRWARGLDASASARARLPLIAFVVTFVALSTLSAKQTHYLIPTVFPMGAVLAGCWLDRWIGESSSAKRCRGSIGGNQTQATAAHSVPPFLPRHRLAGTVMALVVALAAVGEGWIVPRFNEEHSSRRFIEAVDRAVPKSQPLAWTIFGSHSDYLWHFSADRVAARGIYEIDVYDFEGIRSGSSTGMVRHRDIASATRYFLKSDLNDYFPWPRYVIVFGPEADALADVADVVVRDDHFQRKDRSVVLLKSKEPK